MGLYEGLRRFVEDDEFFSKFLWVCLLWMMKIKKKRSEDQGRR